MSQRKKKEKEQHKITRVRVFMIYFGIEKSYIHTVNLLASKQCNMDNK